MFSFDLPKGGDYCVNSRQLSKTNVAEKEELGQTLEREVYIPFFEKDFGDFCDLAIHTSPEIDGDTSELFARKIQCEKEGNYQEAEILRNKIKQVKLFSPRIDIIIRFKQDGSHLAIQCASIDDSNNEGMKIALGKKDGRFLQPTFKINEICEKNEDKYCSQNLNEEVPKIVVNFIKNIDDMADLTSYYASSKKNGRNLSRYECLNRDTSIKDEIKQLKEKKKKDVEMQTRIINDMILELREVAGENEEIKKITDPKIKILESALKQRRIWKIKSEEGTN